jgi:hypothetical protein
LGFEKKNEGSEVPFEPPLIFIFDSWFIDFDKKYYSSSYDIDSANLSSSQSNSA